MRIANPRCATAAAAAVLALLAFAGCQSAPTPAPTSTESADAPVFTSDEEALAAATEAYAAYLRMSDRILSEGGRDPDRIRAFVSSDMAKIEIDGFADVQANGYHSTGDSSFSNMSIQSLDYSASDGMAIVTVYLCSDVSAVDVLDQSGNSVVSPDRPDKTPFQVVFDAAAATKPSKLVVASADVWDGADVCG